MEPVSAEGPTRVRPSAILERVAVPVAVLWIVGVAITDLVVGGQVSLVALLSLAPFMVVLRPSQNATLAVGALAIVVGSVLGVVQDQAFTAQHFIRILLVALSVGLAEWITVLQLRLDRALELARRSASRDELTGLLTRREVLVQGGVLAGIRHPVRPPLSVLMIDIDHFKEVNDSTGHMVGDEVLAEVARRCQGTLRAGDLLGRYGGDEFLAVLVGGDHHQLTEVADRLRQATADEPVATASGPVAVTVSVGLAVTTGKDEPLDSLIKRADVALYQAKSEGRDRLCVA